MVGVQRSQGSSRLTSTTLFILQPRALAELVLNGWIRPTKGGLASAGSVRSRSGIAINDLLLEMDQFH